MEDTYFNRIILNTTRFLATDIDIYLWRLNSKSQTRKNHLVEDIFIIRVFKDYCKSAEDTYLFLKDRNEENATSISNC